MTLYSFPLLFSHLPYACVHGKYISHVSCMKGKEEEGGPGYQARCISLHCCFGLLLYIDIPVLNVPLQVINSLIAVGNIKSRRRNVVIS